jgi:hypothetical protein
MSLMSFLFLSFNSTIRSCISFAVLFLGLTGVSVFACGRGIGRGIGIGIGIDLGCGILLVLESLLSERFCVFVGVGDGVFLKLSVYRC